VKLITLKRLNEVIEADQQIGFCLACGRQVHFISGNAKDCGCTHCGTFHVFGARYIREQQWFSSS